MSAKQGVLVPSDEPRQMAAAEPSSMMSLIERLATNPKASVEKIERMMSLLERGEARKSEAGFNSSMAEAQALMRPVVADADNPQTRSRYASYEALDRALRPIYTRNGFGLSFDTGDSPQEQHVRVLCYVTHAAGHARTYHIDMPADGKGAKGGDVMTKTHATGSAVSYGMRYLLKMIFNVAVGEDDDDGNAAGRQPEREVVAPPGFAAWWDDIQASAENGWEALKAAWNDSDQKLRTHVTKHNPQGWEALRKKAAQVKA